MTNIQSRLRAYPDRDEGIPLVCRSRPGGPLEGTDAVTEVPANEAIFNSRALQAIAVLLKSNGYPAYMATDVQVSINFMIAQSKKIDRLRADRTKLLAVLRRHHDWHLNAGTWLVPDGDGGHIEIDNGAEYADSTMCDETLAALMLERDHAVPHVASDLDVVDGAGI